MMRKVWDEREEFVSDRREGLVRWWRNRSIKSEIGVNVFISTVVEDQDTPEESKH